MGSFGFTRKFASALGMVEDYDLKVPSVDTASLQRSRLLSDALENFDAGLAELPDNAEALLARAELLLSRNLPGGPQTARAVHDAERALELAISQGLLHSDWVQRQYRWILARTQIANRDWEAAVRTLEATIRYANTRVSRAHLDEALSRARNSEDIHLHRI